MRKQVRVFLLMAALVSACGTPMGGRGPETGGNRGPGQGTCRSPVDQLQEQLAETAQALQLTPRQVVLWEAYQASVSGLMADQIKREIYAPSPRSALQQIDGKVDMARNRLAAMEDIAERATALYRSLDNGQKKIADQRLAGTVPALYAAPVCQGDAGRSGGEGGGPGAGGRGGPGGMERGEPGRF